MITHSSAERLQKLFARLGLASRRETEAWIRAGRITVNGQVAQLGQRVSSGDQLRLDGRLIRQRALATAGNVILLCHRSPGVPLLSASAEGESFAARIPHRLGRRFTSISPMPQIDGGLELLTADGALAARLQRLVRRLPVEFSLRVRGELLPAQLEGIQQGLLDRGTALQVLSLEAAGGEGANRWYALRAVGASGNDLRQLLERQGVTVSRLLRTALGELRLDRSLARGRYRELTEGEAQSLTKPPPPEPDHEAAGNRRTAR